MPSSGVGHALELEAVYLTAPIPRNIAVLTVLGAVFDKVYFPGVYLPKEGFDIAELDKEISRLQALPGDRSYDRELLIGVARRFWRRLTRDEAAKNPVIACAFEPAGQIFCLFGLIEHLSWCHRHFCSVGVRLRNA